MLAAVLVGPSTLLAQAEPSPAQPAKEGSVIAAVLVLEAMAFGSGAAARTRDGARVVGVIDGVSGVALLAIAASTSRASGRPEFTVPYGLGLLGLSYYNLANASSSQGDRRFWVNVIGVNVTALISLFAASSLGENRHMFNAVRIGIGGGSLSARIAF